MGIRGHVSAPNERQLHYNSQRWTERGFNMVARWIGIGCVESNPLRGKGVAAKAPPSSPQHSRHEACFRLTAAPQNRRSGSHSESVSIPRIMGRDVAKH